MRSISGYRRGILAVTLLLVFLLTTVVYADNTANKVDEELPRVGSMDNLKELLAACREDYHGTYNIRTAHKAVAESAPQAKQAAGINEGADFSATNVQVAGVDEADIVKTDGTYIYKVNKESVVIVKAFPADQMELVSQIKFTDPNFSPDDIYLDNNYLVLIGTSYYGEKQVPMEPGNSAKIWYPPYSRTNTACAVVYDISDKAAVKKVREIDISGYLVSTRKIGNSIYMVCNQQIPYYDDIVPLPVYRDTIKSGSFSPLSCDNIRYFPGDVYPSYINIVSFNIMDKTRAADIQSYLGNGENIYASQNNLYVALTRYKVRPLLYDSNVSKSKQPPAETETTAIYKFGLQNGQTTYKAKGEVPGNILNQFSMDEYSGYFRIATTTGDIWREDENTSRNNIYVLNTDLKITGRLENIAPGEQIYSTRFMGSRGYMVTFKDTDPFFVVDLKNPVQPVVLGKLKIPGYSDYLHPYDENHIIGFGKDTIQLKSWEGKPQAYYQGLKLALFNVSDVNNPIEKSRVVIGDRGSDSEVLRNHKALLFSHDKNLLAFPATIMTLSGPAIRESQDSSFPEYGSFSFQGAYVYNLDLEKGFQLKGRITHLSEQDYKQAGDYWYNSERNVERVLYIGSNLYTLSQEMIKVHSLDNMQHIKTFSLK